MSTAPLAGKVAFVTGIARGTVLPVDQGTTNQ
jgi:hypothetical protein